MAALAAHSQRSWCEESGVDVTDARSAGAVAAVAAYFAHVAVCVLAAVVEALMEADRWLLGWPTATSTIRASRPAERRASSRPPAGPR